MDVAGVDGCPSGWIVVWRRSGEQPRVVVISSFADLVALLPPATIVAVDMPIGLPGRVGVGGRGPESALRPHLGARQSSVFSVPSRAAVYAPDYRAACDAALLTSDPSRKISKQAYMLFPKIREIDGLLRADSALRDRVHETHPEGVFMMLNGGRPLAEPKKVKGKPWPAGMAERRALLAAAGMSEAVMAGPAPRGAALDDLLDACACSVAAARIGTGLARSFPLVPERDAEGLPMAIWA